MQEEKQSGRMEGFSDGVFGIAMTLLVLELRVPTDSARLAHDLAVLAPKYFAFALSFATILIMWVNHHGIFLYVRRFDAHILFSNGLLLLFVTFMPFPTALLGDYLLTSQGRVAAAVYALSFVAINLSWILMWHSIRHRRKVVAPRITDHDVRALDRSLAIGLGAYVVAAALALVSAVASAALVLLIAVFWTVQAFRRHEVTLA
ncbi:MAG: TMEM175 family protein [Thermoplasmatota archaeon]|nr:DUF1211 domain-containing protein [Halobacteriales archaeon]